MYCAGPGTYVHSDISKQIDRGVSISGEGSFWVSRMLSKAPLISSHEVYIVGGTKRWRHILRNTKYSSRANPVLATQMAFISEDSLFNSLLLLMENGTFQKSDITGRLGMTGSHP